ncbi:MAG: hypothetical protein IJ575_12210 [Selenomonadaceae bacterium]|nr:hypothetical protein [Selenomonadaceae bacterium]
MEDYALKLFNVLDLIKENFQNGIRDDFIDTNKLMRIFLKEYPDEEISRDFILEVIHENGIHDGDRFYFISTSDATQILNIFAPLFKTHSIIFYSEVIQKNFELFKSMHIFSPQVLKRILKELDSDHFYFDEFCSAQRSTELDYEILKFFLFMRTSLSLERLESRFPYVPRDKIVEVLNDRTKYLPTKNKKFFPTFNVQCDIDEVNAIEAQIDSQISKNGFATFDECDLSINFSINHEIFEKDICDLIFEKFFADKFVMRGRRIFKKGQKIPRIKSVKLTDKFRDFIAEHDEITIDKLFSFSEKLKKAQYTALDIAYESMLRVDKNLFVRDSLIHFDIDGIDESLDPFVQGKIISIRDVTSFTGFPPVDGYSWNLFMLESFLRKFSRRYAFDAPVTNSSNIGAIYPRSMKFKDYLDLQATVIIQEKILLEKSAIYEFLKSEGYRAQLKTQIIDQIIERVLEIRNL